LYGTPVLVTSRRVWWKWEMALVMNRRVWQRWGMALVMNRRVQEIICIIDVTIIVKLYRPQLVKESNNSW
jgi:hypothetical protein